MRALILGSFPPHPKRWDYEFYYPNAKNHFWFILAEIAGRELQEFEGAAAVRERQRLMRELGVGVQNMGRIIYREGESALDSKIEIVDTHDILEIFQSSPKLESIILPGYSGKSSTFETFKRFIRDNEIPCAKFPKPKGGEVFEVESNGKAVKCVVANSTSYTAKRAGVTLEMLVEQFRKALAIRVSE